MGPARRALLFAFLSWLLPFAVSVAIFPLKRNHTPLFESLMGLTVPAVAVGLGLPYLRRCKRRSLSGAVGLGFLWMAANLGLDLLLFSWGPMRMSLSAYMGDIGIAYLVYPVLLAGLTMAAELPARPPGPEGAPLDGPALRGDGAGTG